MGGDLGFALGWKIGDELPTGEQKVLVWQCRAWSSTQEAHGTVRKGVGDGVEE